MSGVDQVPELIAKSAAESAAELTVESLEAYLDGQMSPGQAEAFRVQSESDPVVAAALSQLVNERASRNEFFSSLERHDSAEDVVVGRLLAGVDRAIDQEQRRSLARGDRIRMLRYIAAAAACVVFSFSAGWIGHGHSKLKIPLAGLSTPESSEASLGGGTLVSNLLSIDSSQSRTAVGSSGGPSNSPLNVGVNVILKDQAGHVLGMQHFASLDEAREFAQDVAKWQQRQQQLRVADPLLFRDRF